MIATNLCQNEGTSHTNANKHFVILHTVFFLYEIQFLYSELKKVSMTNNVKTVGNLQNFINSKGNLNCNVYLEHIFKLDLVIIFI